MLKKSLRYDPSTMANMRDLSKSLILPRRSDVEPLSPSSTSLSSSVLRQSAKNSLSSMKKAN